MKKSFMLFSFCLMALIAKADDGYKLWLGL